MRKKRNVDEFPEFDLEIGVMTNETKKKVIEKQGYELDLDKEHERRGLNLKEIEKGNYKEKTRVKEKVEEYALDITPVRSEEIRKEVESENEYATNMEDRVYDLVK